MEVGDEVWIAKGGKMPLVLRRTGAASQDNGTIIALVPEFEFVGDCYVHGIMGGEWVLHMGDNYKEIHLV